MTLDPESGKPLHSFGKDMFLMPHGLTIDGEGNHYVTDVGLHQVLRVSLMNSGPKSYFRKKVLPDRSEYRLKTFKK